MFDVHMDTGGFGVAGIPDMEPGKRNAGGVGVSLSDELVVVRRVSEMFVEDDSSQIWIKGWRNQSRLIDKCSIGEIISVSATNARSGLEGRIDLFLTPFSSITKKN